MSNFKLRDYQKNNAKECTEIILKYGLVYLQHEVRCGKTLTALQIAKNVNAKKILFLTKKKAIESILSDYRNFNFTFDIEVINYESLHKVTFKPDLIVCDEASTLGAYPKPSKRTKLIKLKYSNLPIIFLSGTPATESYSQWFHQFWVSKKSPFRNYVNFYKWAKDFTTEAFIYTNYGQAKDYSKAKIKEIDNVIFNVVHKFTQKKAGFVNKLNKQIHYVTLKNSTYKVINKLKKDRVVEGKNEVILADTAVKLMSKEHQLGSGSIIFESGKSAILDNTKAIFIKDNFKNKKLAILYYFKEELQMLLDTFGDDCTTDLNEFNITDKHYLGQQYSSAMGVNLSKADCLVYLNFGFSGTNYHQSLDRLTIKTREITDIHFIIAKNTIDYKIWQTIEQKNNFTKKIYEQISN